MMHSLKNRGGLTRGVVSTKQKELCGFAALIVMLVFMINLTGIKHRTSEQYVELGASRQFRDAADL